jgi:thiol:disulfide interchange protein
MPRLSNLCSLLALGGVLLCCEPGSAQSKDPFDESNKAQPVKQAAVPSGKPAVQVPRIGADPDADVFNIPGLANLAKGKQATPKVKPTGIDNRIDLFVDVTPTKVRRGEIITISVHGVLRPGFLTYPMTKRADDSEAQPASALSRFRFDEIPGLQPLAPIRETGETEFEVKAGTLLTYQKDFTWSQDLLVLPDSQPGPRTLQFGLSLIVCDTSCVPGEPRYVKTIEVSPEPALALTPAIEQRLKEVQPPPTVVPVPVNLVESAKLPVEPAPPSAAGGSILGIISVYMLGALAMLFTPCVFPMIPITVSICLKQSQKENHNALMTAGVYALTIIVMLTASMMILGTLVQTWANNVWVNLALGFLMVYFALSLFGMYEIELPRALANFTNAREDKGGYLGVIFMALTFTITSFTCTGPFIGPILAANNETKMTFGMRLLASLTYSATFAAPFFVLALFPSLTRKLPKSGGWLNSVKVVMGFIEVALAFKFLSISDLGFFPGQPMFFNYETVLCAWIGLSIACGLYLLGIFRLPHDSPVEYLSVPRMLLAGACLSFAIYITPALWRITPQGFVGANVVAFLPLDTKIQPGENQSGDTEWYRDYETAYKEAVAKDKLIFIDFTGQNCANCRYNEKNVFPLPEVQQELKKYVRVQLYTDTVPDATLSAAEAEKLAAKNSGLRENTFNDSSNPLYAIIQPRKQSGPFVEKDGTQQLAGADRNRIRKGQIIGSGVPDFVSFLRRPLQTAGGAASAGTGGVQLSSSR